MSFPLYFRVGKKPRKHNTPDFIGFVGVLQGSKFFYEGCFCNNENETGIIFLLENDFLGKSFPYFTKTLSEADRTGILAEISFSAHLTLEENILLCLT